MNTKNKLNLNILKTILVFSIGFIFLSQHIIAKTTLRHNELKFSYGGGFTDHIPDNPLLAGQSVPIDVGFKVVNVEDGITKEYMTWLGEYFISDPGTMNFLGSTTHNFVSAKVQGFSIENAIASEIFSGTRGLGDIGVDSDPSSTTTVPPDNYDDNQNGQPNAWTKVILRTDLTGPSLIFEIGRAHV